MKKLVILLSCGLLLAASADAGDRLLIAAGLSYMQPADPNYRSVYGDKVFYPEAWAGYKVYEGLYVFAGLGWLAKNGTTPELALAVKSTQQFLWGGVGYVGTVAKSVLFKVEAGLAGIGYKEEAMELTVSGTRLGLQASGGLLFVSRVLFTGLELGWVGASDTVEDVRIKLGGLKASLSIGVRI